jgi:hypothetical protein
MQNVRENISRLLPQLAFLKIKACLNIWNHLTVALTYLHNPGTIGNTIHNQLDRIVVEECERHLPNNG